MILKEYLFRKNMKISVFSRMLECNRSYLNDIVNGVKKPGKRLAKDIEAATDGEVTFDELMNPLPMEEQQEKQKK